MDMSSHFDLITASLNMSKNLAKFLTRVHYEKCCLIGNYYLILQVIGFLILQIIIVHL